MKDSGTVVFNKPIALIVVCLFAVISKSFSQVRDYEVPNILPPSPIASAFVRYDDIPVDISTGVPQITIPIYTIRSRQLEIPLVLSYHASGIKLNDVSTPVGLGWVISGMTGLVSRTVLDRPDEDFVQYGNGWYGRARYPSKESYENKLNEVVQTNGSYIDFGSQLFEDIKYKDKQADRFNFQLPGSGSGIFRYDFNTGEIITVPYKPVKIDQAPLVNHEIPSFNIVDEKGTKYTFDKPYKSSQENGFCSYCYNGTANTSWYLTRIESADGTDVIRYEYHAAVNSYTTGNFSDSYVWGIFDPNYGTFGNRINPMLSENHRSYQFTTTHEPLLHRIVSSTAIVEFQYTDDRHDMPNASYRLSSAKVIDPITDKIIKTVTFDNNHYFGSNEYLPGGVELWGSERLYLKGITINDARGGNTYTFGYLNGYFPPYNTLQRINANQKLNFAEDFWGYYNGENANKGLVPTEFINAPFYNGFPYYLGNRRPNADYAQTLTLNEINYPTGGKTQFFYEGNSTSSHAVGGLRIKKIVNAENEAPSSTAKTYLYSGGYIPRPLSQELFSYSQYYNWDFEGCGDPEEGNGSLLLFDPSSAPRRNTTNSSSFCSLTLSSGSPVIYSEVKELIINALTNEDIGRTDYTFDLPEYNVPETYDRATGGYWHDIGSYTPPLLSKKILKKSPDGNYVPVQETLNTHSVFFDDTYHMGIDVFQTTFDIDNGTGNHIETGYLIGQSCTHVINPSIDQYVLFMHILRLSNHTATTKISLLTQTIEKQYHGSDTISVVTDIEYNLSNLQPRLKKTTGSDGTITETEYLYPVDYLSIPVYAEMVNRNIISPVVEVRMYKNDIFLESSRTDYFIGWPDNEDIILPKTIVSKLGDAPEEIRVRYHSYDNKGNVLSVSKENDVQQSFIWGYGQSLPIAKVINAKSNEIFYTSFEEGAFHTNEPAKTGVKNSNGPFTKTLTSLSNGDYELSYWQYEGDPAEWIHHTETVTVSNSTTGTDGTYTINLSGGVLDDIRFYPRGSQMTTFTYQPLVGVTSITDPASQTTFYEYDHEGRLSTIRNNERKVISKTGYSYLGSPENLIEGAYYNHVRYGWFTRSNCETGYVGTRYVYEVPAFKHFSLVSQEEADLLAQMDIDNNGQAQANLYGTCIPAFGNNQLSSNFQTDCPQGFVGTPVTYTVYAGTYRATSQAEADQMALQDISDNGQAYANNVGVCYDSSLPFVKLTFENQTTQTVTYGAGEQFDNMYQDVVIRFYQDPQRTIPLNVSNVQVELKRNWYLDDQYGSETQTFTVSGNAAVLHTQLLFWGYDTDGKFHEESFTIMPGTGYNTQ